MEAERIGKKKELWENDGNIFAGEERRQKMGMRERGEGSRRKARRKERRKRYETSARKINGGNFTVGRTKQRKRDREGEGVGGRGTGREI